MILRSLPIIVHAGNPSKPFAHLSQFLPEIFVALHMHWPRFVGQRKCDVRGSHVHFISFMISNMRILLFGYSEKSHGSLFPDLNFFPTSVIDFKSFLVQLDYRWDSFHNLGHIEYTFYQKIVVGNGIYPFLNMFQASVLANSHMICIFSVFDNSLKDTIDRQNQLHHFDNPHKVLIS